MKQRLINYLIVLAGILAVITIAVGFGIFMHTNNNALAEHPNFANKLNAAEWKWISTFYVRDAMYTESFAKISNSQKDIILQPEGNIFLSLKSFSKSAIATQVVPVFTTLIGLGAILLYFYLNKRERAKIKENINLKWVRHSSLTTSICMAVVLLITVFLSYLIVGLDFVDSNYYNLQKNDEKITLLIQMLTNKKNAYIAVFVIVILLATTVVGFNNFVSFRITYQITAYATKHKFDADRLDPRTEYFDVVESSQDAYMKFVINQKNELTKDQFERINKREDELIAELKTDFALMPIDQKIQNRQKATTEIFSEPHVLIEEASPTSLDDEKKPTQGSSGNF
ncbi:hypothetical protein OF376_02820 [Ureaplasma miroungigenitalium]|uniref:Uncharacterized protein n=1 Tax=Ureaplasma miroungigenitalium TaxID=1042321 RepID=A0ABT3BNA8_9BACT|nr:hypothetical protein [Ureaplasma miroungigenitalium]MCV3728695.1 hypothetical protein [Ureaplasma miroungigenitalium]MCV3734459.1 hypothetical protein [Ureaplasma miroungigenitalium]